MCHGGGVGGEMTKRGRSGEVEHSQRRKRSLLGRRSNWFLAGNEFAVYKKLPRSLVMSRMSDVSAASKVGGVTDGALILKLPSM